MAGSILCIFVQSLPFLAPARWLEEVVVMFSIWPVDELSFSCSYPPGCRCFRFGQRRVVGAASVCTCIFLLQPIRVLSCLKKTCRRFRERSRFAGWPGFVSSTASLQILVVKIPLAATPWVRFSCWVLMMTTYYIIHLRFAWSTAGILPCQT